MPQRRDANVGYTPYATQDDTGNLGGGLSVRSNPNQFGAQVGAATEKLGDTAFDLAIKQQGMVNETLQTNADSQLAVKIGQIKGDYMSMTGLAAHDAFPEYQQSIEQARQEARANLPPGAQKGFDTLSMRMVANHIADGASHAASQLKDGLRQSYADRGLTLLNELRDPQVASDPTRSKFQMDSLKFVADAQIDENHPGLKTNPETGSVSFDESTPEGRYGKEEHQRNVDNLLSQGYVNKYDTLAKQDVFGAYDEYTKERNEMPRSAQVANDAAFAPRLLDAHKQIAVKNTIAQAQRAHYEMLTNPGPQAAINTVLKNEGGYVPLDGSSGAPAIYGINGKAHPEEYAKAKEITDTQGADAGQKYAQQFYKTEYWDKKGIGSLPPETQTIVMDGVVNHSSAFGDKLIAAAKDGASPQTLIDMRKDEYQRLATTNPEKYGASLAGWNNRLDSIQQSTEGKKTYATNENGGPLRDADYYRTHSDDVLKWGDQFAEAQMPGDLALKRLMRETLNNHMSKVKSDDAASHALDTRNIMKAVNGELSNGKIPATEDELRALPGMGDMIDNAVSRDPTLTEKIPIWVSKAAHRNTDTNSANGYDAILSVLDRTKQYDRQSRIEYLSKGLGSTNPGFSINMKDFNDAKPAVDFDDTMASALSKHMQELTNANGNLDGKGQERAVQWYNQVMAAKKQNDALGDKKLSDADFIAKIGQKDGPPPPKPPSRIQQIENWAKEVTGMGKIKVVNPDGVAGYIPADKADGALKAGYKKVQ